MAGALLKEAAFSGARYSGANWLLRRVLGRHRLLVLCYHGVVEEDRPQESFLYRNTVSLRQFRSQLEFLNRHFHPLSAADLIHHVQRGIPAGPRSVLVTFDDGYRNNLTNAAPLLLDYGTPALFNITTGYIGRTDILWPDEINLRILNWPHSPIPYPRGDGFSAVEAPPDAAARIPLAQRIRAACKDLPDDGLTTYLEMIRQTPCPALEQRDRELYDFLSWDDVRSLVAAGFDIGSHTISHPILTQVEDDRLDYELMESKSRIEAETGRRCQCVVYPNGQASDFSEKVEAAAERAGYLLGFTATGSYASIQARPYAISRIGVPGQPADLVFESRVSGLHTWAKSIL